VSKLSPFWYPAIRLLVPLHPHVTVDVAAVSAAEASRFACAAVETALEQVRVEGPAEPWIISTDGVAAPEEAYQAARRKHGARWRRPAGI
jgi:hypothetical protein